MLSYSSRFVCKKERSRLNAFVHATNLNREAEKQKYLERVKICCLSCSKCISNNFGI